MSMGVSGYVYVSDVLSVNKSKNGTTYFNVLGVSPDDYVSPKDKASNPEAGRSRHRMSISVPETKLEEAEKKIKAGQTMVVRTAKLYSKGTQNGGNLTEIRVQYNDLLILAKGIPA